MRILVADDDPTSRLIAATALRNLGHQCDIATDGYQAWDFVRSNCPDVVISDLIMPGLSGLQLCRNIRAEPAGSYTYFVLVTSHGARDQILEGMNAGADDYLVKPLDPDDLQARLIAADRVTALHRDRAHQRAELERLNLELTAMARRDALSGLGNRRALEEDLVLLEARVRRYRHQYCLALIDVDCFKSYNDTYGHQAGDQILRTVAAQMVTHARGGDALYRYGGEEFLCIFPEQSLATGIVAAERMRTGLVQLAIPHPGNAIGLVTLSAGLAVLDPAQRRPVAEVLKEADEALYLAKHRGRNRVEQAAPKPAPG